MKLGISCAMCSLSGYAEMSRNILMELDRLGVDVYLELTDYEIYNSSKPSLPVDVINTIDQLSRPIPGDIPILTIGTPPQYKIETTSLKVGIGLFEAYSLPTEWVKMMSRMDLILTLSNFNRQVFIRQGLSKKKIAIIPPAVDSNRFTPDVDPYYINTIHPFTILFVGQLILRKGWDKLIIAALRTFYSQEDVAVILKLPPIHSRMQLEAIESRLKEIKHQAGASRVPIYYNHYPIPVEQVPKVYQVIRKRQPDKLYPFLNGDNPKGVFALPSLGEGIALPLLEAQASGLLTLGTNSTGQEFLNPENAIIVNTGPPKRDLRVELEHSLYRGAPFPVVTAEAVSDALMRAYKLSFFERQQIESLARRQVEEMTYEKCCRAILQEIEARM